MYSSEPGEGEAAGGWLVCAVGLLAVGGTGEPTGGVAPGVGLRGEVGGEVPLKLGRTPGAAGGVAPGVVVVVVGGGGRVWEEDTGGEGTPGVSKGAGTAVIGGCSLGVVSGLIAVVAGWSVVWRSIIW